MAETRRSIAVRILRQHNIGSSWTPRHADHPRRPRPRSPDSSNSMTPMSAGLCGGSNRDPQRQDGEPGGAAFHQTSIRRGTAFEARNENFSPLGYAQDFLGRIPGELLRPRSANSATSPRMVKSFPSIRCKSQMRCSPAIAFGLWPPILPGATLPVFRNSRTRVITVLTPTPNRAAAWRRDMPPFSTAATTAHEDQWNKVGPSDAGLHSSQHLESESY
jgi:hypothetical protein